MLSKSLTMRLWLGLLLLMLLVGCSTSEEEKETGQGVMFVSSRGGSSLLRFDEATLVAGDVLPKAFIRGNLTRISQPGALTYEAAPRRLYVPNGGDNSILVFENVRTLSENVPPTRILFGLGTQLARPVHVVLDSGRDLLYVANAGTNSVQVYPNASTIQGGVAPVRSLAGSDTKIGGISHLWLDTENDRLWVVDPISSSLLVFNSASTLNGNVPPSRIITGSNSRLQAPQSILLVGKRLYVACTGIILRFEDADGISGDVAPTAVLFGAATGLIRPQQMALRADKDELYVADSGAGAVFVFANASTANGGPAFLRRLQGQLTNFVDITGLVLDFTP